MLEAVAWNIYIFTPALYYALRYIIGIDVGTSTLILFALLFELPSLFKSRKSNLYTFLCVAAIVCYLLYAILFMRNSTADILSVGFVLAGFVICLEIPEEDSFLNVGVIFSIAIGMLYLYAFAFTSNSYLSSNMQPVGYALMPIIIIGIVLIPLRKKDIKVVEFVACIVSFAISIQLFLFGTRGAIFTVICFLGVLLCVKGWDSGTISIRRNFGRIVLLFLFAILAASLFNQIINVFEDVLSSFGIESTFIEKNVRLLGEDDLGNGRSEIFSLALEGISNSPIFGNGVLTFEANTGYIYPHNIILQTFYEGGILLAAIIFVPILVAAIKMLTRSTPVMLAIWMVLFFCCFPGLMVSMSLWNYLPFWLLYSFSLKICFIRGKDLCEVEDAKRDVSLR